MAFSWSIFFNVQTVKVGLIKEGVFTQQKLSQLSHRENWLPVILKML